MANTLTVKTSYTAGISTNSEGFCPCVKKHFDASKLGIAANAVVVALKLPEGSILKHIVVDVKTAGTGTIYVGNHIGATTTGVGTTTANAYNGGATINLATLGKTLTTPTAVLVAADTFIVLTFSAAEAAVVFDVIAVVEVIDLDAVAN
jgi:hypothetical protein